MSEAEIKKDVDWMSALSPDVACEGVHTIDGEVDETVHPADFYVRSRCSHCDRTQVKAVCLEYTAYLLSKDRAKMVNCQKCDGLTPPRGVLFAGWDGVGEMSDFMKDLTFETNSDNPRSLAVFRDGKRIGTVVARVVDGAFAISVFVNGVLVADDFEWQSDAIKWLAAHAGDEPGG